MNHSTQHFSRPVLGFVAHSGTGKTTLLEKLIPLLQQRGIRVALLKHAHHDFDIDQPGKDSYRLRQAGAGQVMIASRKRWALINENPLQQDEPQLHQLLQQFDPQRIELLLVEGFKHESYPKIELQRQELAKPSLHPDDPDIIAVAANRPCSDCALPQLDIDRPETIAEFIMQWLATHPLSRN
ncbi:MAG TPA: molybdopterin-guanine dinucleotide biosynthesis protein B [Gammaproteobacteria bacterium]